MNRKQQWSKSKTSNILTPYMEGLCVKLFDHRHQVQSIYIGKKEWLVMRKSFFETSRYKGNINDDDKEGLVDVFDSNNGFISKHLKFEHCRHVTLDNHGYMKCDCGWMSQYLAPCIHIMSILDDAEFIVPDLFHIRWWKQFNYYFDKPDIVPNLQDSLQTLFDDTNLICFLLDRSFYN